VANQGALPPFLFLLFFFSKIFSFSFSLLPVGFEPTSSKTVGLKSTPLDHSGITAYCSAAKIRDQLSKLLFNLFTILFLVCTAPKMSVPWLLLFVG
jgi:hypothetical protein